MMRFEDTNLPEKDIYRKAFSYGTEIYKELSYDQEAVDQAYQNVVFPSLVLLDQYCSGASKELVTSVLLGPYAAEYIAAKGPVNCSEFSSEVVSIASSMSGHKWAAPYGEANVKRDKKLYVLVSSLASIENLIVPSLEAGEMDVEDIAELHDNMLLIRDEVKGSHPQLEERLLMNIKRFSNYYHLDSKLESLRRNRWISTPKF